MKGKYGGPLGREIAKGLYDGVEGAEAVDSGVVNQALMELGATYQSKVRRSVEEERINARLALVCTNCTHLPGPFFLLTIARSIGWR